MRISEFQRIIREAYFEKDSKRGLGKTFMWFIEEIGELAEALKKENEEAIREEIADVFAWLTSLANLVNVDLEAEAMRKYGSGICPRCKHKPCKCIEY